MEWFTAKAPIRAKLLFVFQVMTAQVALAALVAAFLPLYLGLPLAAFLTGATWLLGMRFRKAIADPYVTTVVRMEALAAGDLDSHIEFTDYEDCVGRMTKAMFTFRDTARDQLASAAEQSAVVAEFSAQLERLSGGDLTAAITSDFKGDYVTLKSNYNKALESLRALIGTVIASTAAIRTGSQEIAQASENLARRTESNAASLEETAASIAQMDGRLKATAAAAERTVDRADGAISTVKGGRDIADEAVRAMGRVSESAKGIDSVIEGLDKIAFQTRVLAMNAAVEAGRAGEAGRGFAVVADLVSALAMRAEEEAGRARDQLTETQGDIETAVGAVERVDAALSAITEGVSQVHGLLGDMAADNQAQAGAITEISSAVTSMDQATQQNAAMVEETSAAARSLTSEVDTLAAQASTFVITQAAGTRGAARPAIAMPSRTAQIVANARPALAAVPARQPADADDWASF
ncbi:methyl-accepting chemotaxis protein [Stakelama tenebrarum]|uniref:Chemotaxis protein n=1 Tax=Stakelama tenebrarum TaxID=2711215 RepID=A0A6G6YAS2_9SPHN|nr:methyl-accepting chemotaxis protein [Sphingosinithalassobacter tenebrarum]QIG81673.1 chemotaxis protein [Sphingosinithalassobacter tenebrarum]